MRVFADAGDHARGEQRLLERELHALLQRSGRRRFAAALEPCAHSAQHVRDGADRLVQLVRERRRHLADRQRARSEEQPLAVLEMERP
jgi:hypothetical protein